MQISAHYALGGVLKTGSLFSFYVLVYMRVDTKHAHGFLDTIGHRVLYLPRDATFLFLFFNFNVTIAKYLT